MSNVKEQTLGNYESSEYGKEMIVGESKQGKTVALVAGCLGVLPWQEHGGVVTKPENLHVLTSDAAALAGAYDFMVKSCKVDKKTAAEIAKVDVINMQESFKAAFASDVEYDGKFFGELLVSIKKIQDKTTKGGVHALIFSSLTGFGRAIQRAIAGPSYSENRDGTMKKSAMDQNKWGLMGLQLNDLQNIGQRDGYHCIWEAHLMKKASTDTDGMGQTKEVDTIQVQGSAGSSWAYNVERTYRFKRKFGTRYDKYNVDQTYYDTKPRFDFIAGGRQTNELLDEQEPDITLMFHKLNLKIGGWGV